MCLRQNHHWPSLTSSILPRRLVFHDDTAPARPNFAHAKVPAQIERPEYVGKKRPKIDESDIKTPETIERMRVADRIAAQALEEVGRHVRPGVTTDELDRIGHDFLVDHGAYPSTLGYKGYPKSLCTSINEVICHGIPDDTVLRDGDIVNVDITAYIGGVHGDTDATFLVGEVDEESRLLVERTREATMRAIKAVAPAASSTWSAGSSRRTPRGSATAWCATSPAMASARASIPA